MKSLPLAQFAAWLGASTDEVEAAIARGVFISDGVTVSLGRSTPLIRFALAKGTPLSAIQPARFRGHVVQRINNIFIRRFIADNGRTRYQLSFPDNSVAEYNLLSEARSAAAADTRFLHHARRSGRVHLYLGQADIALILSTLPATPESAYLRKKLVRLSSAQPAVPEIKPPYKYAFIHAATGERFEVSNIRRFAISQGYPPSTFVKHIRERKSYRDMLLVE